MPVPVLRLFFPDFVSAILSEFHGKVKSCEESSGTFTLQTSPFTLCSHVREITVHGTGEHPEGVAHRTVREISISDRRGRVLQTESHVYTGLGYERIQWTARRPDSQGRPLSEHRSDGTFTENVRGCCSLSQQTDARGLMTSYEYDGLDRPEYEIRESLKGNIRTDYSYDVNETGPVQTRTVSGGGLSLSSVTQYDRTGRTEYAEDAAGLVTSYAYSADGRTVTVTRPDLSAEITERHRDGRTKSVSGTGVIPVFYEYGVNPDGSQWTKVYTGSTDSSSPLREMSVTDMLGRTVKTERPGPDGGTEVSENVYDAKGRLIRSVTPGQAAVLYEYDDLGNQIRSGLDVSGSGALELSSADRITESETLYKQYGPQWWQESVQRVYAAENSDVPTSAGISRTRLTGLGTAGGYGILTGESVSEDIHGNTAVQKSFVNRTAKTGTQTVTYPDSDTAAVSVTQKGLLISSKGKSGHTVIFDYDTMGRRISVTDPRTGTSQTVYNAKGQTESVTDAAGNRTEFSYDAMTGQKRAEKNALGKHTRYQYNSRGQITRTWGEAVYPAEYVHDSFGRLSEMRTFRDGTGWESGQWPGTGTPDITKWHYQDSTGLLLSKEYADGKQVAYAYAPAGKLSTRTWARTEPGQPLTTTYVYDPATAELKTVDYSDDTADITFAYDRLGRQKQITDAAGTRTFTYNSALQPESESITGIYSETLTRTYEDGTGVKGRSSGFFLGNPDSPEYAVTYGYGTEGRFGSLTWNAGTGNGIVNYSYVPDSDLLSGYTTDTGIKTAYEYEPHRSLKTSVTNSFGPEGSETTVSGYGYLYDSIGRRTSVKNTGTAFAQPGFNRYGYNDRSELISSERYRGTEISDLSSPVTPENRAYQYDPIGNRKESAAGTQQSLIYETNVLNQYTEISQNASPVTAPEYDDDGNILKYKDKICQWNAENRLISVQPQNPAAGDRKITFLYDYMGRRIRKQVFTHSGTDWNHAPETEKLFVYDGWNVVKETTVTGGAPSAKYYVWGLDLSQSVQGAGGIGGLLCSLENGTVLYYFYDGNGNTAQVINAADGSIAAHYEYDAFGNTVASYGAYADANPFRFSTKYFDAETGLYYYGFRYYSAELGRWWSRDPIGENGGISLYLFVFNNQIDYTDPLGLKGLAEYIYDIHVFFQEQWDYHSGQAGKKLHSGSLPGYLYHGSSALVSGVLALAVPENDDEMFLAVITFDMAPALAEGAVYLGKRIVFFRKCGNTLKKAEPPEIPPGLMDEAARLEKQWAKQIRELLDSGEIVAVDASKNVSKLQTTFDDLAEQHLLPKYRQLDPNLKAGYTGSFKTGVVGNPDKSTFGQPIDLNKFDVDYWIESDILYEKFGKNLRADVEFRKLLSETPGFEGLKPNKQGFSIKFKPSSK